uniref:GAG-pre-integrase domain-containing protein n=1 Tax=Tanacetum cinerariifolium TaxID=118510 RepID=A0A699GRC6_TANCI|nr:hypothetical protein [Tanacetum cinerariifolium]
MSTKPQELSVYLLDKRIPNHKLYLLKLQFKQVTLVYLQGWTSYKINSIKFCSCYKTIREISLQDQNKRTVHGTLCDGLYLISPPPSSPIHPSIILHNNTSPSIWHSRLGYFSFTVLKKIKRSIKFRGGSLGIKCTRHSHCQVKSSHWQNKFPLPVKVVATARRLEMPLPEVCTAIKEKKKKLPVKDRWQLH